MALLGSPVFKRRKPEEPPAPTARGHVVASGPAQSGPPRSELRGIFDASVKDASKADPSIAIPAAPPQPTPSQLTPVAATPPLPKEPTAMSRPPLQPTPTAPTMPQGMPQTLSRTPMPPARVSTQSSERRTLVVGRGISVQGTIQDAERLVVEGTVEASSLNAHELQIAQGGVLKGQVEVEDAEISGLMDGMLTVRGSLVLRGTGQVIGEARCRRLQVEDGGQLSGKIGMITDSSPAPAPNVPVEHDAG
jgi:cytoskeletal protein CcmA (bactofilin family)